MITYLYLYSEIRTHNRLTLVPFRGFEVSR